MTLINGNTNDGGAGTGSDGHRVVIDYSVTQDIPNNKSVITFAYGVNYGDPNYWNAIDDRTYTWTATQGTITDSSGGGTTETSSVLINTSDPGYGGQTHYFGGVWSGTITVTHDSNGEAVVRVNASMFFPTPNYTSSITNFDITLPDIVQDPVAPGTPTATRINDGQVDLSWTNNSSAHHEYASQSVQRSVDGGSYSTIASGLSAGATSYSDTSAAVNHKYTYKIVATNASGTATSGVSTAVYTTPGTPTIGTATKLGNGNISLTWTNNVGYGDTAYTTRIEESQNGGAFSELASVSGGVASYEHVAPSGAVTHAYRVRHRSNTGSLNGAYSATSNTVTLLSTANAPTGLSPSGVARDAAGAIVLTWTHNPTDGTPQSKRRVQAKVNAGAYADLVNDSSGTSSYTVAGGTWTNGDTITWKVATAGENGTLSAYSAESTITLSAKPTVTINTPTAEYGLSQLTVEWGYFQAQSSVQAAWEARLYDTADVLIEAIQGTTGTSGTFAAVIADGATYTVAMTVTSAAGLASTEDSQEFTVAYLLPAGITVDATFDNTSGFMVLALAGAAPISGYAGLVLDGTGDYASTPDAAALDIAGDIDIRIRLYMTDWTPAANTVLVAKWVATGDQRAYEVVLTTAGMLRLRLTTDGTAGTLVEATSSAAPTIPGDGVLNLRIDRNSGVVTFYTSVDADLATASWTQLGTTQNAAGTIFASTATLQVGADGDGTANLAGTVYAVELRNSADAVVANPNFAAEDEATTTFDDGAGLTWTLAGNAAIVTIVPATVEITTVDVQRRINGGEWITLLTGVVLDSVTRLATVQDTVPITVGTNVYRAIAYSALPSSVMSPEETAVTAETVWGYLSGEAAFATVARFRAMPSFTPTAGRDKEVYHFAGRSKPVQLAGEAVSFALAVAGKLTSDSATAAEFEALGQAEGVHCWRGPDGRRVFGSLSPVSTPATRKTLGPNVSFAITELDFVEGDQ